MNLGTLKEAGGAFPPRTCNCFSNPPALFGGGQTSSRVPRLEVHAAKTTDSKMLQVQPGGFGRFNIFAGVAFSPCLQGQE